jgi:hypothetical protein
VRHLQEVSQIENVVLGASRAHSFLQIVEVVEQQSACDVLCRGLRLHLCKEVREAYKRLHPCPAGARRVERQTVLQVEFRRVTQPLLPDDKELQPAQQEQALAACFKEDWSAGGQKAKRILLPVRSLHFWIESNILLILKLTPFDKRDAQLATAAGSCLDCPKRTGHNKLLFLDMGKQDTDAIALKVKQEFAAKEKAKKAKKAA